MEHDIAVVGAGPIGIEIAANLRRQNIDYVHFDSHQIGATISRWPDWTPFFSSPERVAIAGVPLQSTHQSMLTGEEYLAYLRLVCELHSLQIRRNHHVERIEKLGKDFRVHSDFRGEKRSWVVGKLILAHGNMHSPRALGVPGEELEHVDPLYADVHRYFGHKVCIVGGRNSAVEAAIRCFRAGADVTLVHRRSGLEEKRLNSRYHLEISILVAKGKVRFIPDTRVAKIDHNRIELENINDGGTQEIACDYVIPALGFDKDTSLFEDLGIPFLEDGSPVLDEQTMEASVPGVFLAGTAAGGKRDSYSIFVGTSHIHVQRIMKALGDYDAITGDGGGRDYPFARSDIESTEGKA